jgi:cobalt/nickel transport system permease protein
MPELFSLKKSLIHRMDARVKLILTLAFILFVSLTPVAAWPSYILYLTFTISIAILSHLGVWFVMKRAIFALPFALAAIPLVFTGPEPDFLWQVFPGIKLSISSEGMLHFTSIAIKSWISVQAAILLAATTRFPDLLIAFKQLQVPGLFVAIIGLMWRYLYVIFDEAATLLQARASRSAFLPGTRHSGGTLFWRASVTGGMAGSLFLRSIERSDRVYAAMLSRGYTGELSVREKEPLSKGNLQTIFLGLCLIIFIWFIGVLAGG